MGKHVHVMSGLDTENRTGICANCGPVSILRVDGRRWGCAIAQRARRKAERPPTKNWYRTKSKVALAANRCERCGFEAEDICQLDVDHIVRRADGGTSASNNLQVLCANCHRLKSKMERRVDFDMKTFMAYAS